MYPVMKPWLFRLDAERAHVWTTWMMRMANASGLLHSEAPDNVKAVQAMGLRFPNVLGLAAGMDKSASCVDAWGAVGFGFVEVGTLTPRPQPGNPKPRLFRLPEHEALREPQKELRIRVLLLPGQDAAALAAEFPAVAVTIEVTRSSKKALTGASPMAPAIAT